MNKKGGISHLYLFFMVARIVCNRIIHILHRNTHNIHIQYMYVYIHICIYIYIILAYMHSGLALYIVCEEIQGFHYFANPRILNKCKVIQLLWIF